MPDDTPREDGTCEKCHRFLYAKDMPLCADCRAAEREREKAKAARERERAAKDKDKEKG